MLQGLYQETAAHQNSLESVEDKGRHLVTEQEAAQLAQLRDRFTKVCAAIKVSEELLLAADLSVAELFARMGTSY